MFSVLVIPSCRPASFAQFVAKWSPFPWDVTILVEDNPTKTITTKPGSGEFIHLCWEDIDAALGEDSWIISRRDSAIRSFGFLHAWKRFGSTADIFLTLDDDCYPLDDASRASFVQRHYEGLSPKKWSELVPGMRTRGLPYFNLGKLESLVHVGLWNNVPDFDAPQALATPLNEPHISPDWYQLRHPGQYWPFCGMNVSFHPDAAPLMYFPKMGMDSPYARFDDMWCGTLLQKICAANGWWLSTGLPHVWHSRASDPMVNLVKEAPGIRANEVFWELIDKVKVPTTAGIYTRAGRAAEAMVAAGEQLVSLATAAGLDARISPEIDLSWLLRHAAAVTSWGKRFTGWGELPRLSTDAS